MERAPAERRQQEQNEDLLARRRLGEDGGEPVAGRVALVHQPASGRARRHQRAIAGTHGEARHPLVEGAAEQVLRVVPQCAGRIVRGRRRPDVCAAPAAHHDLAPAQPAGERVVAELDGALVVYPSREVELDPCELQAPLTRRERDRPAGGQRQGDGVAVQHQMEPPDGHAALATQHLGRGQIALLEGRDLGLVEDVVDAHVVARDRDLGEVVDGEVAQGMRRGGRRGREQHGGREPGCEGGALHRSDLSASAARGANSGEKRGLSASAPARYRRAADESPACFAAIPAW